MRSLEYYIVLMLIGLLACGQNPQEIVKSDDGTIETYDLLEKDGVRHGPYHKKDEEKKLIEKGAYDMGKLHGQRTVYHPDGVTAMVEETYHQGQFQGSYKTYYRGGELQLEGQYIDGIMKGTWNGYYVNGQLKESVQFEDNMENGAFIEYYDDGALKAKGSYLNGPREHGELFLYDSLGVLERKMMCDNGRCATTWTPDEK